MKVAAAVSILAVIAVIANAQEGVGKPNKKADYLRALQEVEEATLVLSLSLSFPAGIEGQVVDVADMSVLQSKAGKTEFPSFSPTLSSAPTKEVCTIPGGKSGKNELYCLEKECGLCAAAEAVFVATKCPSVLGQQPDACVSLDYFTDFVICKSICDEISEGCDPSDIPTIITNCFK